MLATDKKPFGRLLTKKHYFFQSTDDLFNGKRVGLRKHIEHF